MSPAEGAEPDAAGYAPVACGVYDRLEQWAVRGTVVEVAWRDGEAVRSARTTLDDITARGGADWVRLGTGAEVRADRLVRVGGVAVAPAG